MSISSNLTWVDTHCHLEKSEVPLEEIINQSKSLNVNQFITIGTEHHSNRKVVELTRDYAEIHGTVGFHPHDASDFNNSHADWIADTVQNNQKILAIGECGLDYHYNFSDESSQKNAFAKQLELAGQHQFPVVIHTRNAEADTIDIINSLNGADIQGVFHCFTSSFELAKYALNKGFYISFNGICTFPKSDDVREVLKYTPPDRILLETDSPYLAPVPHRGKKNIPGYVSIIGQYVSNFLNIPIDELAKITYQNTKTLFPRFKT